MSVKRDYKSRTDWNNRKQMRRHGVLVIVLIGIGLIGSVLAYLVGGGQTDDTIAAVENEAESKPAISEQPVVEPVPDNTTVTQSLELPKPKYSFYNELENRTLDTGEQEQSRSTPKTPPALALRAQPQRQDDKPTQPEQNTAAATANQSAELPPTRSNGRYVVQAGAFRNAADADRLKAKIALLGVPARIEQGKAANGTVWHRVRVGPYQNRNQASSIEQRLQSNAIDTITLKTR